MTRILVTGGSSYLGQHLVPLAVDRYDCLYTYFSSDPLGLGEGTPLDVRDGKSVRQLIEEFRPEVIIHTAGSNRSPDMEEVIVRGANNVTTAAKRLGARLIHISSDVIFDGTQGPYSEHDPPCPVHEYGRSKAAAESIASRQDDHVIVRTSLIYGLGLMDLSTKWIISTLESGEPVTLYTDQVRNPVWAESLSEASLELAASSFRGIINIAGRQVQSRAELGLKLLDWWGFEDRELLKTGESDPRWPRDCRLDLSLADKTLNTPLPGVDEVLRMHRGQRGT